MAYASLVSLEQTINHVLINHHKYSISVDETEIVTSIREYVNALIPFLDNLPEKANSLEGKIRDSANEAEDLIEYFMTDQFRMDLSVGVRLSRVEFIRQLKRVGEEIGSITGDMMDDRLCHSPVDVSSSRAVAATRKNDVVMGLDADLLAIKFRLCGESCKLEVIPIVGMGGIGKTTLARCAYDDSLIIECFDIRVFVQVSQVYSAKEFLSNVLASMTLIEKQVLGKKECEIAEKVYKSLKGRRYLIVMDDIWSTEAWDDVRNIFPDDNNRSRIMLTTRDSNVAAYASSGRPFHEMKFMDGNQSWDLLKQKVFTNSEDCPPEVEDMGKAIARDCRGLPLAVVLVAGILSTIDVNEASWEKIANNVNSVVDGALDKILSLSYRVLPHHLRSCFLFMAGFPEDHKFYASRLIKLWVAEGFLKCENEYKSLEDEAEECLEDLVKRSLVLVTSRKVNGKIKSCSLHDLVRGMCIKKAQEEKFLLTDGYVLPNGRIDHRRIGIGNFHFDDEIQSPTVRTIIFPTLDSSSLPFLVSCRLLRILEVIRDINAHVELPPQAFELFHLRYLSLAFTHALPAAISKLVNLQTLIIGPMIVSLAHISCSSDLPPEIWRLPHLRHLVSTGFYHTLPDPPDESILPLQNLQTLSGIASLVCSERIMRMIPNLKKLGVLYYINDEYHNIHNLARLHQLEKLKLSACFSHNLKEQYLAFPSTLKELSLLGAPLLWEDMSIVGSLPNLQVLKLKRYFCQGTSWETKAKEFPQLRYLLIEFSNLQQWITETDHFPRLKCLVIRRCYELTEIPDCIGEIPTLETIEVDNVLNVSLVNSLKQMQEDQNSYGNDALQIRFIRNNQTQVKNDYKIYRSACKIMEQYRKRAEVQAENVKLKRELAALKSEYDRLIEENET